MTNAHILSASQQWATRPADERYSSLADMLTAAEQDRTTCKRAIVPADSVEAVADGSRLLLLGKSTGTRANLTNWSYSQLAAIAGAPGGYLRTLPAQLAADCLNVGLQRTAEKRDKHALLLRNGGPAETPYTVRALTSEKYSRLWDARPVRHLLELQQRHPEWQLPMSWNNIREGAYRGDRDMFVFMTNGGSIIEDPTLMKAWHDGSSQGNGQMYRGIIVRNSEVGAASLSVQTFLFRFVCGNHIIWHADNVEMKSRRHVGLTTEDAEVMINKALRIADASAAKDQQQIAAVAALAYGKDKDDVIARARKDGLTETDATGAYDAAERHNENPRSTWGIVNGITRHSQTYANQDDRTELDNIAGKILQRARIAVAA